MSTEAKRTQTWAATRIPNLFLLKETGTYYGRVKVAGKSFRKSFETKSSEVARVALRDWLITFKRSDTEGGRTLGSMVEQWLACLDGEALKDAITKSTIAYKVELLDSIRGWQSLGVAPHPGTWPGFNAEKLENLTEDMLAAWLIKHRKNYSATRTNGAVTVLREIGVLAVRKKCMLADTWDKAAKGLTFVKVSHVQITLPEPKQVEALRIELHLRCQKRGTLGGWLFDFLLFSGARIDSAVHVLWEDVKWSEGRLDFRKAKRGAYFIPLFPQLRELLEKIRAQYPDAKPTDKVLPTLSIQTVLTSTCADMKISHLSHHDLRHLFATRCIESGVDIPTVSRWLGHRDGGTLAMKTYGHLRQTHSQQQAATVNFLPATV